MGGRASYLVWSPVCRAEPSICSGPGESYRRVWLVLGADGVRDACVWASRFEKDERATGYGETVPWAGWKAQPYVPVDSDDVESFGHRVVEVNA